MPKLNYRINFLLKPLKHLIKPEFTYFCYNLLFSENMQEKPLILVTNDDGITAPGIRTLIKVMNIIGDVVVVAPDNPQS